MEPLLTATPEEKPTSIKSQAAGSQLSNLCTKQPLNKGHLCIMAKTLFPKGACPLYRGSAVFMTCILYIACRKNFLVTTMFVIKYTHASFDYTLYYHPLLGAGSISKSMQSQCSSNKVLCGGGWSTGPERKPSQDIRIFKMG